VADAAAVHAAAKKLENRGFERPHPAREQPWGQTVARAPSAESLIVGMSFTPSLPMDSASSSESVIRARAYGSYC
jgi:hypothetical protein